MNLIFLIIIAVIVIGILWYVMIKKKGPSAPKKPEGPSATPPTEPPTI